MISRLKINELPLASARLGIANKPWYFTAGSNTNPTTEIVMITSRIPPGTRSFSSPKITASPSSVITTGNEVNAPKATGRPSSGFFTTRPTPLAAISNRNRPIPMPVP
ncbi:hypothetical protein D3C71_1808980 [compost metagenome]